MRRTALLVLAALAAAPATWAQVAAPSLLPVTLGTTGLGGGDPGFVPVNPALLAWPSPSQAGWGVLRSQVDQPKVEGGFPASRSQSEGSYGGVHISGGRGGFAAEVLNLRKVSGDTKDDHDKAAVGAGIQFGGVVALGASYHDDRSKAENTDQSRTGAGAGVSLRLWEHWYAGAAGGSDRISQRAATSEGVRIEDHSTSFAYGVGYRNEGSWQVHVEGWAATLGAVKDENGRETLGGDIQSTIAEVRYGVLVAGLTLTRAQVDFTGSMFTVQASSQGEELTAGVAERGQFALLLHYGRGAANLRFKALGSGTTLDVRNFSTLRALSVVWQY